MANAMEVDPRRLAPIFRLSLAQATTRCEADVVLFIGSITNPRSGAGIRQ